MDSTLMTIIGIVVAVILLFIWPLMAITERNDDIAQITVQTLTTEFVDKIAIAGCIKPSDYEAFQQKLAATGNTYEIEIEVQHLDENPGKKSAITSGNLIGENVRYSTFTSEILDYMYYEEDGVLKQRAYPLNKGDNVIMTAKNTNITMADVMRTAWYKISGKGTPQVTGSASSMALNSYKSNN